MKNITRAIWGLKHYKSSYLFTCGSFPVNRGYNSLEKDVCLTWNLYIQCNKPTTIVAKELHNFDWLMTSLRSILHCSMPPCPSSASPEFLANNIAVNLASKHSTLRHSVQSFPQSCILTHSVVSSERARFEIQDSRDQTRLRSMDFSERKNPVYKSSGRGFKLGVPSLRFQAL